MANFGLMAGGIASGFNAQQELQLQQQSEQNAQARFMMVQNDKAAEQLWTVIDRTVREGVLAGHDPKEIYPHVQGLLDSYRTFMTKLGRPGVADGQWTALVSSVSQPAAGADQGQPAPAAPSRAPVTPEPTVAAAPMGQPTQAVPGVAQSPAIGGSVNLTGPDRTSTVLSTENIPPGMPATAPVIGAPSALAPTQLASNAPPAMMAPSALEGSQAVPTTAILQPSATGMTEPGNINLNNRPVVQNPDGSISTVRSISINDGGKEVLIPTVSADGSRILTNNEAIDQYRRTGQHLGKFNTPEEATRYAQTLHQQQEQKYVNKPGSVAVPTIQPKTRAQSAPQDEVAQLTRQIQILGGSNPELSRALQIRLQDALKQDNIEVKNVKVGGDDHIVFVDKRRRTITDAAGNPYVTPTGEDSDAGKIAEAIISGKQPPTTTGLYRQAPRVRAILADRDFDESRALLEWQGAQKQILSLNGPQMVRYAGLAKSVDSTIDEVNRLAKEVQNSGVVPLNAAKMAAYINVAGNTPGGQLAARYMAAVNTLKEEFANLANGGYAPTEPAWTLANQQINGNYGVLEMGASLGEVQRLIRYRLQGIPNFQTLGPGAPSRYVPGTGAPAKSQESGTPAPTTPSSDGWENTGIPGVRIREVPQTTKVPEGAT